MFRRLCFSLAAIAALMFVAIQPASAQQRIALVIGNAAYPKGPLATSLADGGLVAEALTSIGFEIVEGADVNQTDLRKVFRDFLAKVEAAGPDTIAFVYYSGYAIQFEGDNYLIPVDARLDRDSDIPIDAVRLFDLLRPLADAPALAKMVVLDATRLLPFQIQGGQLARGLGAIESAPGMLVAFSSAPGTNAADGQGPYGAYATAIAEMVREPGLDIDTMFARIRLRTNEATNGVQTPWEVSQLQQVVMLVPGQAAAPQGVLSAPQTAIGAPVVRRRPPPRPIQEIGPEEAYAYVVEQDELPVYVEYVRAYPNSPYAQRIWATIRARREALLWRRALLENLPDSYWTYIERYPDGMYVFDARRRLRRLAAGDRPPSGWRMRNYDDVPMPLSGEPARMYEVYPSAPPPRRYLAPPPAFIVGLPPPRRDQGLWRRPQPTFPIIVTPPPGPRPGVGPGGRPPGVGVISPPPGAPPPGTAPGFRGPPPQQGQGLPKGPAVVTQPPPGGPPPGFKGPPPQGLPKGPAVVTQPPTGAPAGGPPPGIKGPPPQGQKGPAVVNQPPPGPPPGGAGAGAKGPPPGGPPPQGQKGPAVVNQPPPGPPPGGASVGAKGPPPGGPPPGVKGPPPQTLKGPPPPPVVRAPPPPQVKAPPPPPPVVRAPPPPPPVVRAPPPPPPVVRAPPPPPPVVRAPPPPPPVVRAPPPPPPQAQKGPPPAGRGLPKCATVGGKQPCAP
jgi:hypothetical protein